MEVAVSTEQSADAMRCQFLLSTNEQLGKNGKRETDPAKNTGKSASIQ